MNHGAHDKLPEPLLERFSEFLAERMGLYFPRERWGDLVRGMAAAAREAAFANAESYARWLLSSTPTRNMIEILASHLTVGETYFFRERQGLEVFEQDILPELLRSRRSVEQRIRIWSAGCCTGEEPYSIAMLLDGLIPDIEAWNITIVATDINPRFLRKAAEGAYSEWSFRDTPGWLRERYFTKRRDGRYEILPRIRKMVAFSYLNLAEDVYPSLSNNTNAMDAIFCRNVLMYFTPERARKVAGNLYNSLVDGGWLFVSPAETSNLLFSSFTPVDFPGAVLYRKLAGAEPRRVIAGQRAPWPVAEGLPVAAPPEFIVVETPAPAAPEQAPAEALARVPEEQEPPSAMARLRANQGRLGEAIEWCEKAIAADKLNPSHHYLCATIRQEEGRADEAAQSLKRALYLDPDFALAHFALGNLYLSQGRSREAERHFGNALALLQKHPQDEAIAESEGLTAGRLIEIIQAILSSLPRVAAA